MPHERKRHLYAVLRHIAKLSPLVGVLGHRQVGKTTLLEAVSSEYMSLDDEETLLDADLNPKAFLEAHQKTGTAIDECQFSERLFPALKERVRRDKRPGQFYLSGSVRFTSKKLIRESLTGRIMSVDLLPLTLSELDRTQLPELLLFLLRARKPEDLRLGPLSSKEHGRRTHLMRQYETHGGLPGVCFIRNEKLRAQKIIQQLETILNRDLRQIHETTLPLPDVLRFVRQLSLRDGGIVNYQELRRLTGLTPITQKKMLFALEATFILRHIPIEGDIHGSAIIFEDHAEVAALAQNRLSDEQRWSGLIYRNLREQILYRLGENAEFFQYRTRAGVLVPIAIRSSDSVLGIIPVRGRPSRAALGAAQSFLRRYGNSKIAFVTDSHLLEMMDDRTVLLPASMLLF